MEKKFFAMMVLAMVAMFAFACGDDDSSNSGSDADTDSDSDSDSDYDGPVAISGAMQKGPLIQGSSLTVAMLDDAGVPTGANYNATTTSDLGTFNVVAQTTGACELIGEGYYYNEISDHLSGAPITFRAFYEIVGPDPQKAYLNVFTHMSSGLALKLYRGEDPDAGVSYSVAEAVAEAENTLYTKLGIIHPLGALEANGTEMDLTGEDSPDNQYVMAVSCIVGKAAQLLAVDSAEVDAKLQMLLNDIRSQLQMSGDISATYKQYIRAGEAALDPLEDCVNNLANYLYNKTGEVVYLPDPNSCADMDGDGIVNSLDPDIDGDGVPNDNDSDSYNMKVGNGTYLPGGGLAWELVPSSDFYAWDDASNHCDELSLGDFTDWRMPTIDELQSLIVGCSETTVGCIPNEGPADGCYWSDLLNGICSWYITVSDWDGLDETCKWHVDFRNGFVFSSPIADTTSLVRCVRSL